MLRQHQASLDDRKKFTALVKDLFPDQAKNVNLLLMAYNMGIAQDIQSASHINNTFAFRYVKQLMDDFGMSRVNADWIVSVWCFCYGGKVLGKACDISIQKQGRGPAIQGEQSSSGRSYALRLNFKDDRNVAVVYKGEEIGTFPWSVAMGYCMIESENPSLSVTINDDDTLKVDYSDDEDYYTFHCVKSDSK